MATDDQQVLVTGQAPAPATFKIPGNGQIRPKAVFASFDGAAAASAFLPALKVTSDAGETVGIYPTSTSVAAGASADVSWFPRVAAAASTGTGTGVQWFYGSRGSNFSVPSATLFGIPWTHIVNSDSSVFTMTTTDHANDTVVGNKAGVYIGWAQVLWALPAAYPREVFINTSMFGVSGAVQTPVSDSTSDQTAVGLTYLVHDSMMMITSAVPQTIAVAARNLDAVAHNVTSASFMIGYWPNSTFVS